MFSAVAWIMGDKLQKELKIPIGLVDSSVGATRIDAWISPDGFNAETTQHKVIRGFIDNIKGRDPNSELHKKLKETYPAEYAEYQKKLAELPPFKLDDRSYKAPEPPPQLAAIKPATDKGSYCSLYNAMIHPLAPMTFRAIIWYQGEANRGDKSYDKKMRYLWDSWRKVFEQPDLPFYFAQIAPFEYKGAHHSPELWRQQQFFADENYPAAGLVVTMDVGDLKDIHPTNKRPVGERFANLCLVRIFGREGIVCDSPFFESVKLNGGQAVVTFRNARQLKTSDGNDPNCFEVAGSDLKFVTAKSTRIEGNKVIIGAGTEVPNIAFVRFAWRNDAQPNLQNEAGLPAGSFRTDDGTK
jgi:sialate O-acetylesterase